MAQPPRIRGIQQEAIPGAPAWFLPFLQQFNEYAGQSGAALESQLTVTDNFAAFYKETTVKVPSPAWLPLSFAAGWSNYEGYGDRCSYRILSDGSVKTKGLAAFSGSAPSVSTIGSIATSAAPTNAKIFLQFANFAGVQQGLRINVLPTGELAVNAGTAGTISALSLESMSWEAASPPVQTPFTGVGWPIQVQNKLGVRPQFVAVAQAIDKDTQLPASCETPAWGMATNGSIEINHVPGLVPGRTYTLRFLVLA